MMRMFWHELRSTYKGLLAWVAGVLFFQLSGYSKFEGFKSAADSNTLNSITNAFPKPLAVLFGMNDLNIASLIGYFGILYVFFALIAAIHAGLMGANIIAKEERDKTSEFLYTKPVSRSKVLTAKLMAGLVNVLILFVVISVSSVIGVGIVNHNYDLSGQVMNLMWGILLFQIFFFATGALFAGIFKKPKLPTLCVTVIIVGSYFVSAISQLSDNLNWLRFVTPFRWLAAPSIINAGQVGWGYAGLAIGLSIIFIGLCYVFYNRRDLRTA